MIIYPTSVANLSSALLSCKECPNFICTLLTNNPHTYTYTHSLLFFTHTLVAPRASRFFLTFASIHRSGLILPTQWNGAAGCSSYPAQRRSLQLLALWHNISTTSPQTQQCHAAFSLHDSLQANDPVLERCVFTHTWMYLCKHLERCKHRRANTLPKRWCIYNIHTHMYMSESTYILTFLSVSFSYSNAFCVCICLSLSLPTEGLVIQ